MGKKEIKTKEEARQYAIDWQQWASEQNSGKGKTLYTSDMGEWYFYFEKLANKFDLVEEFKENGII